jgi:hypothetical protein
VKEIMGVESVTSWIIVRRCDELGKFKEKRISIRDFLL